MSATAAEDAYVQLSKEIFSKKRSSPLDPRRAYDFLQATGKFKSEPLEKHVKMMLQNENELLQDTREDSCKV
jgi:hypothetical protein